MKSEAGGLVVLWTCVSLVFVVRSLFSWWGAFGLDLWIGVAFVREVLVAISCSSLAFAGWICVAWRLPCQSVCLWDAAACQTCQ